MFTKIPPKREIARYAFHELLKQAAGFLAGIVAYEGIAGYFRVKKWFQFWGFLSKRTAVDKDTFNIMIFIVSFLVGLAVLYLVNKIVEMLFPATIGESTIVNQ